MMKIKLVAVGSLKEAYWRSAFEEYAKRLQKFVELSVVEVKEYSVQSLGSAENVIKAESEVILKELQGTVVLLDIQGTLVSSEDVSQLLQTYAGNGVSAVTFVIGGSHGVSAEVKQRAHKRISFGKVTYPHQLMRVIFAEQMYRACTIWHHIAYHK